MKGNWEWGRGVVDKAEGTKGCRRQWETGRKGARREGKWEVKLKEGRSMEGRPTEEGWKN